MIAQSTQHSTSRPPFPPIHHGQITQFPTPVRPLGAFGSFVLSTPIERLTAKRATRAGGWRMRRGGGEVVCTMAYLEYNRNVMPSNIAIIRGYSFCSSPLWQHLLPASYCMGRPTGGPQKSIIGDKKEKKKKRPDRWFGGVTLAPVWERY